MHEVVNRCISDFLLHKQRLRTIITFSGKTVITSQITDMGHVQFNRPQCPGNVISYIVPLLQLPEFIDIIQCLFNRSHIIAGQLKLSRQSVRIVLSSLGLKNAQGFFSNFVNEKAVSCCFVKTISPIFHGKEMHTLSNLVARMYAS